MNKTPSAVEILELLVGSTESFLQDPESHNLAGIKALVAKRKTLLAQIQDLKDDRNLSESEFDRIDALLENCQSQDKKVESLIRGLQGNIVESINSMHRTRKSFRGYKFYKQRKPRYIDRKR